MILLPLRIFAFSSILIFSTGLLAGCTNSSGRKAPAGVTDTIVIRDMSFQPENISVHKGDTILWINHDMVTHCVTESYNKEWTSSAIPPEGSWRMVAVKSSDYYCSIHPVMKGRIEIKGF